MSMVFSPALLEFRVLASRRGRSRCSSLSRSSCFRSCRSPSNGPDRGHRDPGDGVVDRTRAVGADLLARRDLGSRRSGHDHRPGDARPEQGINRTGIVPLLGRKMAAFARTDRRKHLAATVGIVGPGSGFVDTTPVVMPLPAPGRRSVPPAIGFRLRPTGGLRGPGIANSARYIRGPREGAGGE